MVFQRLPGKRMAVTLFMGSLTGTSGGAWKLAHDLLYSSCTHKHIQHLRRVSSH